MEVKIDDRETKIIIFCFGMLNDLVELGILDKGSLEITGIGINEYEKLQKEGFEPTVQELEWGTNKVMDMCESQ